MMHSARQQQWLERVGRNGMAAIYQVDITKLILSANRMRPMATDSR